MEYNKRRWLERIQQQQQEEEPRDVYPITHTTYFSKDYGYRYTAIVEVYSKHTIIDLYKITIKKKINVPFWVKLLLKILDEPSNDNGPIVDPRKISNNESVNHTIWKMIVDYEIPMYQRYMAEDEDEELQIEYDVELGKRRQRLTNIDRGTPQEEPTTIYEAPPINDFFSIGTEQEQEQEEQPQKNSGYNEISKWNLKQNQNRKKFG